MEKLTIFPALRELFRRQLSQYWVCPGFCLYSRRLQEQTTRMVKTSKLQLNRRHYNGATWGEVPADILVEIASHHRPVLKLTRTRLHRIYLDITSALDDSK